MIQRLCLLTALLLLIGMANTGCVHPPALPEKAELVYYGEGSFSGAPIPGPGTVYIVDATTNRMEAAIATDGQQGVKFNGLKRDRKYKMYYEPNELFRRTPEQLEAFEKAKAE